MAGRLRPSGHRTHPYVAGSSHHPAQSAGGLVVDYGALLSAPERRAGDLRVLRAFERAFAGSRTNVA